MGSDISPRSSEIRFVHINKVYAFDEAVKEPSLLKGVLIIGKHTVSTCGVLGY